MTANVTIVCTPAHTISNPDPNSTCVCFGEYTGPTCDIIVPYWRPALLLQLALSWAYLVVALYWSVLRAVQLGRRTQKKQGATPKLSLVVMILIALASVLRIATHLFPLTPLYGDDGHISEEMNATLALGIMSPLPTALWMVSSLLIIAFWFDLVTRKLQTRMKRGTKIACIVLSALLLVMLPGLGLFAVTSLTTIATALTLAPLVIDTFALIVLAASITRFVNSGGREMSLGNSTKTKYAIRLFWILCASWIVYMANLVFGGLLLNSATHPSALNQVCYAYVLLVAEVAITFSLLLLGDRGGSPWQISAEVCCGRPEARDSARTTGTSARTPTETEGGSTTAGTTS